MYVVPLRAVGLMTVDAPADGEDIGPHAILMDIQGTEDHYGDMDFKVAGTTWGITAMQARVDPPALAARVRPVLTLLPLKKKRKKNWDPYL